MDQKQEYETQYIKGVGPQKAKVLAAAGLKTLEDLIYYFPYAYLDRRSVKRIDELYHTLFTEETSNKYESASFKQIKLHREYTIVGKIVKKTKRVISGNRQMLIIEITDESRARANIIFFNRIEYYYKFYNDGDYVAISGYPDIGRYNEINFVHPEIENIDIEDVEFYQQGGILPKYTMPEIFVKAKISQKQLRKIITNALDKIGNTIEETLPDYILQKFNFPPKMKAIKNMHFPDNFELLEISRERFKFEEMLMFFLAIFSLRQAQIKSQKGLIIPRNSPNVKQLYKQLPFKLTNDQIKALQDIMNDFNSGIPMNRLLQGDVGSGKTIVALIAMLAVIDAGYQVVLMAPTEILAQQHYNTISNYLKNFDIKITLLLGGLRANHRDEILCSIADGNSQIIIGTHALIQDDIAFRNLGFIVIDEQHRFGVTQKAELIELAKKSHTELEIFPHTLFMSATPIPRTLSMTLYGDLDVSVIREMPKNRKPIQTKVVFDENRNSVYEFTRQQIKMGRQAYIVYPLVEKSEKLNYKSAIEHYEYIKKIFKEFNVGLLHGQMPPSEKDEVMYKFLNKEFDILVATTVVEVGIDVPNATVMIIEDAEKFGLSQLHQLRGRVGRSQYQSYCILFTKSNFQYKIKSKRIDPNERIAAIKRLRTMEETTDGFKIAEVDLEIRGPGDILGTRQSGLPAFKFINLIEDIEIITKAREFAQGILTNDPKLNKIENVVLKQSLKKYLSNDFDFYGIA
ncbi:MAG TPA: ATP-dependent DNA helicase RecG [Bacteroidota bacterium]|nr:ATP-dependent DNA helicase RecG [Bacteroidota bacterium]